jgi:hypothetical protein
VKYVTPALLIDPVLSGAFLTVQWGISPRYIWSTFKGNDIYKHFRTFLIAYGVFVAPGEGSIKDYIIAAIRNDFHVWTTDEVEYWAQRNAAFKTRAADPGFLRDIMVPPYRYL